MKRRRRASEAERSANASSTCPSMAFSAPPRRPISVLPPSGSTRRERSPAPIAAAVSSMRRSGRRLALISHSPRSSALATTAIVTSTSIHLSWLSVTSVSCSGVPMISVESANGIDCATSRKRPPPLVALTVAWRVPPSLAGPKPCGIRGLARLSPGRVITVACAVAEPPWRISMYMPGVSTPRRTSGSSWNCGGPGRPRARETPLALLSSERSTRSKSEERSAV